MGADAVVAAPDPADGRHYETLSSSGHTRDHRGGPRRLAWRAATHERSGWRAFAATREWAGRRAPAATREWSILRALTAASHERSVLRALAAAAHERPVLRALAAAPQPVR